MEVTEMASTPKNPYFRPVQEGGSRGRGAVSPLGGRSNSDRSFRHDGTGRISVQPLEKARGEQKPITPKRFNQSPLVG
jgi:hypothetical protein